jgi:dTDP-4-dehydrorhamnose reductase
MKVLVTGGGGMLARQIVRSAPARGDAVVAPTRAELDVTDEAAVFERIGAQHPEVVIHGAAYTAVDRAEAEPDVAMRVNVEGTRNVARACQKFGCLFVYPSSDYVFDGTATVPYRPTDRPNPLGVYGRSKWLGELAAAEAERALIVRTSWLYGNGGSHFVDTIARLASERETIDVVADQVGRPTWTGSLVRTIDALLKAGAVGTFHASDGGEPVSWAGFAEEILRRIGSGAAVRRISTAAFGRPAPRPAYSVLDLSETERVVGPADDWRESLRRYLASRQEDRE